MLARMLVVAALLTASPVLAKDNILAELGIKKGMRYVEARKRLIAYGFETSRDEPVEPSACGTWDDICANYNEVVFCRGTGISGCEFSMVRGKTTVIIMTQGEEIEDQRIRTMTINKSR